MLTLTFTRIKNLPNFDACDFSLVLPLLLVCRKLTLLPILFSPVVIFAQKSAIQIYRELHTYPDPHLNLAPCKFIDIT